MSIPGDPFRRDYGTLTDDQKQAMDMTKVMYESIWTQLESLARQYGISCDLSIAKTELQSSCMWAVRAITKQRGQI